MSKETIDRMMQAAGTNAVLDRQLESAGEFSELLYLHTIIGRSQT